MSDKRHISQAASALQRQELAERRILLADHNAKHALARLAITSQCEAEGGHEYQLIVDSAGGPDMMGRWPSICRWCRHSGPRE